jgi:HSP20 family molecular chaperone IbpA
MFALMPWRKERKARALVPPGERLPLMEEFDALFDRLLGWPLVAREDLYRPWGIETAETEKEVVFRLELPGFELPELDVRVLGDELIVEAHHEEPAKEKEEKPKPETRYGHLREAIALPPGLDLEKAEAAYRSGILEVRFPKLPEAKGRRIEVKK